MNLFRPQREREGGAAALSLLVTAIIIALAISLSMALPFSAASDRKAANRTAADAAALAGAEWIRTDIETLLSNDLRPEHLGSGDLFDHLLADLDELGGGAAAIYAERNDARLIAYDFDIVRWEATATAQSAAVSTGERPESTAVAALNVPRCTVSPKDENDDFEPADPPADPDDKGEDEDKEEEPPTPSGFDIVCDGIDIDLLPRKEGDTWVYRLPDWAVSALTGLMDVTLIE